MGIYLLSKISSESKTVDFAFYELFIDGDVTGVPAINSSDAVEPCHSLLGRYGRP